VRFTGFRPDAKKLLPGADAVLMTSLQEGMPLALLEAMSAGVPVITTPWLGASELLDGGRLGRVLPDWEPQSIVRALHTAVECPGMLNASAQEAMSVARSRYDISVTVREHERLYRRLLAERKPGAPTARVRQTV
ncbi:MAG TPA: glycosyltransferase, partial [Candidatus Baltobacteraceae bacterium]